MNLVIITQIILATIHFWLGPTNYQKVPITINEHMITAEVVETPAARTRGLSGRTSLANDEGMLFVFEKSDCYAFWMKDMNFPIDIIWLDENGEFISVTQNATPESFPESFQAKYPAKYVLEINTGLIDNYLEVPTITIGKPGMVTRQSPPVTHMSGALEKSPSVQEPSCKILRNS